MDGTGQRASRCGHHMMRMRRLVLLAAAVAAASDSTVDIGGTVFVDCGRGDDAGRGDAPGAGAFRTVARALHELMAGAGAAAREQEGQRATVVVAGVCYQSEPLRLNASHAHATIVGTAGASLSGGRAVDTAAWVPAGPGLWRTQLPPAALNLSSLPNQLWVGGVRRPRARHPNLLEPTEAQGTSPVLGVVEQPWLLWDKPLCPTPTQQPCVGKARYGMHWRSSDDPVLHAVADDPSGQLEAVVYHPWTDSRHHVIGVDLDTRALHFSNPSLRGIGESPNYKFGSRTIASESGQRWYLENHFSLLNAVGEWFLSANGTLWYRPTAAEVALLQEQRLEVVLPLLQELLVINGTTELSFEGISLLHTDWYVGPHTVADGQSAAWQENAAIHLKFSHNISFSRCSLRHHGAAAIWVDRGSHDVTIDGCDISDLGTGGVRIGYSTKTLVDPQWAGEYATSCSGFIPGGFPGGPAYGLGVSNIVVSNCVISDGGWTFASGTGLVVEYAANVTAVHNEVAYFSYTGVSLGFTWTMQAQPMCGGHNIGWNHIHHLGTPRREMGDALACVYTLGDNGNTVVQNNLCHDVKAFNLGGFGLCQDSGSSRVHFVSNVVLRTAAAGIQTQGFNNTFENNLLYKGYYDSWACPLVPNGGKEVPFCPWTQGGLTSAARTGDCGGKAFMPRLLNGSSCPTQVAFRRNIVLQDANKSSLLFQGLWNTSTQNGWNFEFDQNLYFSEAQDLRTAAVFGGDGWRKGVSGNTNAGGYSFAEWKEQGHGQHSVVAPPQFAAADWEARCLRREPDALQLAETSPARLLGWEPVDVSEVGPLPERCCGPLGLPPLPLPSIAGPAPPPPLPPPAPPAPPQPPPAPTPPPPSPAPSPLNVSEVVLVGATGREVGSGPVLFPDNFVALDKRHILSRMTCEKQGGVPGNVAAQCFKYSRDSGKTWQQAFTEYSVVHSYNDTQPEPWGNGPWGMVNSKVTPGAPPVLHTTAGFALNLPTGCNLPTLQYCSAHITDGQKPVCNQTVTPMVMEFSINASGSLTTQDRCSKRVQYFLPDGLMNTTIGWNNGFTGSSPVVRLGDGSLLQTFAFVVNGAPLHDGGASYPGGPPKVPMSLICFHSTDDGYTWHFRSFIARYSDMPFSYYGPNEHDISLLADGQTLLVVLRPDSDSDCPGAPHYKHYYQTYSRDSGKTWSPPRPIPGTGCVRPKLLKIPDGPLLLAGGRLCPELEPSIPQTCLPTKDGGAGIMLWVNRDGQADLVGTRNGSEWEMHCVTAEHNAHWLGDKQWLYSANTRTQAYNSLVLLEDNSVGLFYAHGWTTPPVANFMMRLQF